MSQLTGPADDDVAVFEQERGALIFVTRAECQGGAVELGLGDEVQGAGRAVDDRCSGDAYFGLAVASAEVGAAADGAAARRDQTRVPVNRARIGINRVDTVVLGGDVQYVVRPAADGHAGNI